VAFVLSLEPSVRFVAPGRSEIEVAAPRGYVVWHEHHTVFQNRTYQSDPKLPGGIKITILAPDGVPVPLESAGSQTWNDGDTERTAIGKFQAPSAGRYTVALDGDFPPRVIAVAQDFMLRMLAAIGGAIAVGLAGVATGIGLAVYAFATRAEAEAAAARPRPAPQTSVPEPRSDPERSLRETAALVYGLQAASLLVGITLIAGVIINYLKRDEVAGTWLESHFRWQIRTFWWTLAWSVIGVLTMLILIGFVILLAAGVWFVYRVAKGWLELRAGRPIG